MMQLYIQFIYSKSCHAHSDVVNFKSSPSPSKPSRVWVKKF